MQKQTAKLLVGILASLTLFALILADALLPTYYLNDSLVFILVGIISTMFGVDLFNWLNGVPTPKVSSSDTDSDDETDDADTESTHGRSGHVRQLSDSQHDPNQYRTLHRDDADDEKNDSS